MDARMIHNSGIGRYIQALIPALIKNFQKITLLGNTDILQKFAWAEEVNIIELSSPIYSVSEQIKLFYKTPNCDIFLSPHYNTPIYLPQAKKVAVIIPDTNHLVFRKELSFVKRLYATIFYNVSILKDIIFTISDFSKSEIVKYTNCDADKIIVAKCAIDKDYFRQLDQETLSVDPISYFKSFKNDYILFIGNIKPHKNLKRSLLAFELVVKKHPNLRFLIVGKKDDFLTDDKEVFKLVEDNQFLKQKVHFTGYISDLHLAFLYKHAKVFLFPSLYEGFGLPPLEAMFFGCPVIVSREGSLPEICGDAAYYCNAYDVEDISKAIIEVLLNRGLRNQLINKGLGKVLEYNWSLFNNDILNGLTQRLR